MNIFFLHKHPVIAAQMQCDKHVVKMILESAQLLSTCHRVLDGTEYYDKTANGRKIKRWTHPNPNLEPLLYKAGWVKHPSTIWLFESAYNYMWLYKHMMALNEEYKKRYNHTKNHLTIDKLGDILYSQFPFQFFEETGFFLCPSSVRFSSFLEGFFWVFFLDLQRLLCVWSFRSKPICETLQKALFCCSFGSICGAIHLFCVQK